MDQKLEKEIKAKKIEILYQHGQTAVIGMMFISVIAVAFTYYSIWPADKSAEILLVWLIMFFLVSTIRLYGITLYKNIDDAKSRIDYWHYAFIAGIVLSGGLWGLFFLYLVDFISIEQQNYILFFMIGLISAAVATYATSMIAITVAALTVVGPVITYFLLSKHTLSNYMGYLLIIYLVYIVIIARQLNKTLMTFIAHEFNVTRLEQEKRYAAMINRELEEEILKRIHTEGKLKEEKEKAEELADKLITISSKDGLTGINNRRRFNEYLVNEWNRLARTKVPLSLIICDVDSYKAFNDTYGHLAGDDCLKSIAHLLEHYARRAGDMAARYGGEEFVIILPDTVSAQAALIAEQIRTGVEDLKIPHKSSKVCDFITVSLGVATVIPDRETIPETLIHIADEALYKAKNTGRNKVVAVNHTDL